MKQPEITYNIHCSTAGSCQYDVIIPKNFVNQFFKHAAEVRQQDSDSHGFKKGNVPLDYIQIHYKKNILNHMQEIFLKHFVIDALLEYMQQNKILVVGQLKLINIAIDTEKDLELVTKQYTSIEEKKLNWEVVHGKHTCHMF